jgi:hypothetical protein
MQDSKDDFDDNVPSGRRDLDNVDDGESIGMGTPIDYIPGSSQSVRRRQTHEVEVNVWEDDQSGVDFAVRLVSGLYLHLVYNWKRPFHSWFAKFGRPWLVTCLTSPRKMSQKTGDCPCHRCCQRSERRRKLSEKKPRHLLFHRDLAGPRRLLHEKFVTHLDNASAKSRSVFGSIAYASGDTARAVNIFYAEQL